MAVDAVFKRAQLEQRVDIEGLWGFLTLPSTLTVQGRVGRAPAFSEGSIFVDAELVVVVVVGDVLQAGELFAGGSEGLFTVWSLLSARAPMRGENTSAEPVRAK